ncbi:MAG: DAK2 domain-containing protein [Candidatus Thorarchaeota archaeon]
MVLQEFAQSLLPDVISGEDLYCMLKLASQKLEKFIDILNDVNVFPVPDGDTGFNMHQTFKSIIKELNNLEIYNNFGKVISAASKGAFFGSIGNSGIILAEYFHGLEQEWNDFDSIGREVLSSGLFSGAKCAYQAVENPREGTILTIARIIAETANEWQHTVKSPFELLYIVLEEAKAALLDTHRILPQANLAGVVDAGAMGLMLIFEGFVEGMVDRFPSDVLPLHVIDDDLAPFLKPRIDFSMTEQQFEVIFRISGLKKSIEFLKAKLKKEGTCVLVLTKESISKIKVHIHCKDPDMVISKVRDYVSRVEVDSIKSLNEQNYLLAKRIRSKVAGD